MRGNDGSSSSGTCAVRMPVRGVGLRHLAVGADLAVHLVGLAQADVEDRAGLEGQVARAADGDDAARRGLDRLVVGVGDAGALLAERLADAGAVRVHADQVAGVELVQVVPLGEQHLAGVHDGRGDAVRQVARVELQVAAVLSTSSRAAAWCRARTRRGTAARPPRPPRWWRTGSGRRAGTSGRRSRRPDRSAAARRRPTSRWRRNRP